MPRASLALVGLALAVLATGAGCVTPTEVPPTPQHVELAVPETASYAGLHVHGTLDGNGQAFKVDAFAENQGERTYRIEQGCTTPWSEVLLEVGADGNGTEVPQRAPTVHCLAFSLTDFAPGESRSRAYAWNGTLWDDEGGAYHPAPAGDYRWSIRFIAYAPDGNSLKRFDLDFPIQVV